ncbi:FRG domain-containing protein [uncultured Methylophaga sp.]|uniref:FRG domain-containing protein n=1 Tax=uncultured Methylophaga sp. TaxID=285271 RepID=UPI002627E020|nr:FRG domain-containing protein [uncultured Methylophaga sp.]
MEEEFNIKREEKHFENLPVWPEFDIYDKTIDFLIPSARIESWEDFNKVVKQYRSDDDSDEYVFRGQHHYRWPLQPTLDRMDKGAIKEEIARKQLRNFKLSIRGRLPDNSVLNEEEEELWAIGQHHGLATPLLDWTLAPYVALFFAFVQEDPDAWKDEDDKPTNFSRAIFILNKSFLEDLDNDPEVSPLERRYPKLVEPSKDDHGRLVNQAGLFTIAPYGETLESALLRALEESEININDHSEVSKYICKIHIPNTKEIRLDCLRQLRKMNIHHGSLFPDLIGASGYCNDLIREYINSKNKAPSKTEVEEEKPAKEEATSEIWKHHELGTSELHLKPLIEAMLINDELKQKANIDKLKKVAQSAVDFVNNKAGVDWYSRDSQKARLVNITRRNLRNIGFDENYITEAAMALVEKAAAMSEEQEKKGSSSG